VPHPDVTLGAVGLVLANLRAEVIRCAYGGVCHLRLAVQHLFYRRFPKQQLSSNAHLTVRDDSPVTSLCHLEEDANATYLGDAEVAKLQDVVLGAEDVL
jgi:hypothetical protein